MEFDAATLLQYACERFEMKQYDDALDAFILTYNMGYEQEWILQNIYECYMQGNSEEFQKAYQKQGMFQKIPFEDCLLDFIPYRDGEYYIFDKERQMFLGVFSISEIENAEIDPVLNELEFSAVATEVDWNLKNLASVLTEKGNRKIYVVCHDIRRCMSYWKIPEMIEYLERVYIFESREEMQQYFHENTAEYLPKILHGNEEMHNALKNIITEEHQYRLTPEGRNTSNVLLTIGIPTANRGNLLLKRIENLLMMNYDSEIEISISKNGTRFFEDEYKKVSKIKDARINYYDHGKEIKYYVNWHYTVEMSHGKYVLLVSDEDDVILQSLEHYMKLLNDFQDLGSLRARTTFQYSSIINRVYGKKGLEAFKCEFLVQNYLSGLIVKREIFLQAKLLELERFSENVFYNYYPHECWCAVLSMRGDYMEEPVFLIKEGDSILVEEIKRYRDAGIIGKDEGTVGDTALPQYATYEARLKQFQGHIEFMEIFGKDNSDIEFAGVECAIKKTAYLLDLARSNNYNCDNYINIVNQYVEICIEEIEKLKLNNIRKKELLMCVSSCCTSLIKLYENSNIDFDKGNL